VREVNGQLQLYYTFLQVSGLRSFGSGKLVEIFKERPNELGKLKVEQLAAKGLEIFDPSEIKTLIKLSLSDELLSEAKRRMKDWEYRNVTPQLEWIRFGPPGFRERETADPKDQ